MTTRLFPGLAAGLRGSIDVGPDAAGRSSAMCRHPTSEPGRPSWNGRQPPARRAIWLAWGTVASVVPSAIWRTSVGLGVDLGWSQDHLDLEQIPGFGTFYVIALSVLALLAASLTLGLVQPWGERLPRWLPFAGGRRVPVLGAVVLAMTGAFVVMVIGLISLRHWDQVSGFADRPSSGWARLMAACYLPALLWGPMLLAVTWAYARRPPPWAGRCQRAAKA